jgi:hypothetical protein
VLLESFTRDVEGQIVGIDNTAEELEVLRNEVLELVGDEHTAHIELDVLGSLAILLQDMRL